MHGNAMNAVADFRIRVGQLVLRFQSAVHWLPGFSAILGAEGACRRDGDEDAVRVARIEKDCVQAHAARPRLPEMALGSSQSGEFLPRFTAVHCLEKGRVFGAGIHGIRIGE